MATSLPGGPDDSLSHGDIAAIDGATALTVCFWLKYDTADVNDAFVAKSSATNNGFAIRSIDAADNMAFWFGTGTQNRGRVVGGLTTGVWAHWGFRYDGGGADNAARCRIWKNGVEQSLTFSGTIPTSITDSGTEPLRIGEHSAATQFADCDLANLVIWTAALDPTEIVQQRYMHRPVRTASLLLWCPFAEPEAGIAPDTYPDLSGNGNGSGPKGVGTQASYAAGPIGVGFPGQSA